MAEVVDALGGFQNAAKHLDETHEQVARWRHGKARPPFFALVKLCEAADKSCDWLGKGVPASNVQSGVSEDVFRAAASYILRAAASFPSLSPEDLVDAIIDRSYKVASGNISELEGNGFQVVRENNGTSGS